MQFVSIDDARVGTGGMQDSNDTPTQLYHHFPHLYATFSISAANIQYHFSVSSTPLACNKPNLSPIYIPQQQLDLVKWQKKCKCKNKDWVSDTESKLGTVSTYITPTSLPEKTSINFKIYCSIPSGVLKMPDKL